MNKDLRPEDFWPEAEKLLDKHYKAKRKRKAILWFISALTIIGASIYFISDRHETIIEISNLENQNKTELKNNSQENNTTTSNSTTTNKRIINNNTAPNSKTENQEIKNENNSKSVVKTDSNKSISKPKSIVGSSLAIFGTNNSTSVAHSTTSEIIKTNSSLPEANSATTNLPKVNTAVTSLDAPIFGGLNPDKVTLQNAATRNTQIKEPRSSGAAEYRFDILAGANLMTKEISGYSNPTTESKRNAGESNVVTPQLSIEISRVTEKYAIALGLNYIQYGEKVNYDPKVQTKITIDNSYWNTYTTNVLDTDTNYVYGYVYYSQQTIQRQDSSYISQSDTVEQTVTKESIVKSTGTNVISYVEMPISISYYFGKRKFRYGISAGVSAGMLVYSNGYYLNDAGTDVINIKDEKLFKKIIFNGQIGLDFRYFLSPKTHLLFRPQYRINLDSILKDASGPSQKYSSFGVTAGVSFLIN